MIDLNKKLMIEQLDRKFKKLEVLSDFEIPLKGWVNAVRTGLNMSLVQLAKRLRKSPVSVKEIEKREENNSITLKKLIEAAEALNCKFVYGFIPKESSLEETIKKRAEEIAKEIVLRTSHSMKLEEQENSKERIQKAISERTQKIMNEMPRYLWD